MATRKKKVVIVEERTEICKNCRSSEFADHEFRCHRYAPSYSCDSPYVWPLVPADGWCTDFSAKLDS